MLLVMLCACSACEGADLMLLRAVLFALMADLGLSLNNLATMTLCQALTQALASPLWGALADRRVLRPKTLLVVGMISQGILTAVLAGVDTLVPMIILRSLNGVALAALRPISNAIVAETTSKSRRGKLYGWIQLSQNMGAVAGSLIGAPISSLTVTGVQGWRIAFVGVGCISICAGLLVAACLKEPAREHEHEHAAGSGRKRTAICEEFARVWSYLRVPTFCAIVMQGCFGCAPWNALGYQILFFQQTGLSDVEASVLQALSQCAGALGNLLGGLIGDSLSRRCRLHGRAFTAQLSVSAGLPMVWLTFMVLPPQTGIFMWYLTLVVIFGLTATWCSAGVNWPILSEIVAPQDRNAIYAFQTAVEGAFAAVFGNAAVGLLAENAFGYRFSNVREVRVDPQNVKALGMALMWSTVVPWTICLAFYTLLHWSYPRDIQRIMQQETEEEMAREEQLRQEQLAMPGFRLKGTKGLNPGFPRVATAAAEAAAAAPGADVAASVAGRFAAWRCDLSGSNEVGRSGSKEVSRA